MLEVFPRCESSTEFNDHLEINFRKTFSQRNCQLFCEGFCIFCCTKLAKKDPPVRAICISFCNPELGKCRNSEWKYPNGVESHIFALTEMNTLNFKVVGL